MSSVHVEGLDPSAASPPTLRVHLLAGLPTEAVTRGFERAREAMPVVSLDGLPDCKVGDAEEIAVLLPPFAEPSSVVESWEDCDFLHFRFGRPARIAGVSTFLDTDRAREQLASPKSLSEQGWGRSARDGRTVADILVGQIESATQLVLVGATAPSSWLTRCVDVLNPRVPRLALGVESSPFPSLAAAVAGRCAAGSIRVVPPWLEALHGEHSAEPGPDLFVYRREAPFDPTLLREWMDHPPRELVRGKGHLWLAGEEARSFGYSCAGSVHRVFESGRWWASYAGGAWPECSEQRRRLLERWHPRHGDRRQELVFCGVDMAPERLCEGLDACLVADREGSDLASGLTAHGGDLQAKPWEKLQ